MRVVLLLSSATGKRICTILLGMLLILVIIFFLHRELADNQPAVQTGLPLSGRGIVIDPGHGGYDPGVFRRSLTEKNLNLAISLVLRDYLQGGGARVIMTRETDRDLLVLPAAGPRKRLDMKNRLAIIRAANPDLLVSIHVNASPSPLWSGAQVFHKRNCAHGHKLALLIQEELKRVLQNTNRPAQEGDFFLLNEAGVPAALVEAGFISNPEEARLLADERYRSRLAWAVYLGIIRYFDSVYSPAAD
ncbi:MAG: Germination-specific N-acetylmuramoyl-L-alanine amidase [Syntrophomonadaceae bacterium]|nr:Germination-specific N-acetylmuramoyl-L-alanine amidase [Bacillota bacterium]